MQDGFLFDDNDPKQCGHGIDVLRKKGDSLKAHWQWTRGRGTGMPDTNRRCIGQLSEANVGENILLEAVFWHNYYEARVSWRDDHLASYDVDPTDGGGTPALLTRIDAQRKAEKLARQFLEIFSQELTAAGL